MKGYADNVAFLGQFGRFQQVVFFLLCATIVPNGFGAFTLVFLTDVPAHHCLVPELNLTEDWRGAAIPLQVVDGQQVRSSCSRYKLDVVRGLSAQGFNPRDVNLSGLPQEGCLDGWSYSTDVYSATIVSEYDLVCGGQWKQPFTTTVFFLGVLCGCFFAGQLSDRFGRKPVLFATLAVQTVFTFVQVFSGSWSVFVILLFINSLGQMSNYVAALVLGAEILTGNVRVLYSSLGSCLGFAIGYMILPLFAYFLRDWKHLQLALSLPGLVFLPLWWLIPESPRWLLTQGRVKEAEDIVRKAAKWNRVPAPRVIFEDCSVSKTRTCKEERYNVLDLLRKSNIRITTLNLCLVAFSSSAGYYGLSYNTAQLHGDPFVSCFISGAVEVPAYVTSWLALRYTSRRLSIVCCMVLTAVALCLVQLVPEDLSNVTLTLEMLGKYSITTCFSLMFAYSTELYPTVIRNTATGICNTVSRAGSVITPFMLHLSSYYKYFPYVVMGALALLSAIAAAFLPESFGKPLPETIEEMDSRDRLKCPSFSRRQTPIPVVLVDNPL